MKSQIILKKIIEILEEEKLITISDLSKRINCGWAVTKHNCEIVEICKFGYLHHYDKKLFIIKII